MLDELASLPAEIQMRFKNGDTLDLPVNANRRLVLGIRADTPESHSILIDALLKKATEAGIEFIILRVK